MYNGELKQRRQQRRERKRHPQKKFVLLQPRTQACSRYLSDQGRLGTERDRRIFPTSLTSDVTSEIAEDDWERGWCCYKLHHCYSNSFNLSKWRFFRSWILNACFLSSLKEKDNRCLVFTSSLKRPIRNFHVLVVQWRQRNVQKSVMLVQS